MAKSTIQQVLFFIDYIITIIIFLLSLLFHSCQLMGFYWRQQIFSGLEDFARYFSRS